MTILLGGLVVWIITYIITSSYIFTPFRNFMRKFGRRVGYLFSCQLCLGTWVGIGIGYVIDGPLSHPLLNGLAYHAAGYGYYKIVTLIESAEDKLTRI